MRYERRGQLLVCSAHCQRCWRVRRRGLAQDINSLGKDQSEVCILNVHAHLRKIAPLAADGRTAHVSGTLRPLKMPQTDRVRNVCGALLPTSGAMTGGAAARNGPAQCGKPPRRAQTVESAVCGALLPARGALTTGETACSGRGHIPSAQKRVAKWRGHAPYGERSMRTLQPRKWR